MTYLAQFFILALVAIFVENAVFSRVLGVSRLLLLVRKPRELVGFTAILSIVMVIASGLCWVFGLIPVPTAMQPFSRPAFGILSAILVCLLVLVVFRRIWPSFYQRMKRMIPQAAINSTVLGTLLLNQGQNLNLAQSIGFGLGTSIGFMLAVAVVAWGDMRLQMCDLPKAFRGLPSMLLYIGILSMAIYGLMGHILPF